MARGCLDIDTHVQGIEDVNTQLFFYEKAEFSRQDKDMAINTKIIHWALINTTEK